MFLSSDWFSALACVIPRCPSYRLRENATAENLFEDASGIKSSCRSCDVQSLPEEGESFVGRETAASVENVVEVEIYGRKFQEQTKCGLVRGLDRMTM